ncbi:MAG: hypothetical protein AAF609_22895 [Cyanobacteria bacterium P01_C01_bin.120]
MKKWLLIVPGLCLFFFAAAYIASYFNGSLEADAPATEQGESLPLIDIDEIAGQSPEVVATILGEPTYTRTADTFVQHIEACPCPELEYFDGVVKIMYINGIADWVTVNHDPRGLASIDGSYLFARQFDDHTYVEVATSSEAP